MNDIKHNIDESNWQELVKNARDAYHKAYAPYSNFKVGTAAMTTDNRIVQGCNVENASYGLTVCAERNCIAQGVIGHEADEPLRFSVIVIYTEQVKLTPPCGACRQVISEFFPKSAQVIAINHLNQQQQWTVEQILPSAFTPDALINAN